MVKNPFIEDSVAEFESVISKERLIKEYKNRYDVDIRDLLSTTDKIELYKCKKSGFRFYTPSDISGNSKFYEKLQEHDWYYMPWKWEHQVCSELIENGDKILEVGCGDGAFLKRTSRRYKNIQCVGLELNESSIFAEDNLVILNSTVEDFSKEHESEFDIVCSFQVLEHIQSVNSFLRAKIKCLKEDGLLVICVPNNDSFIKYEPFYALNLPPHHMGLWNEESLRAIGTYYNLDLVDIKFEPLQEYHFEWYLNLMTKKRLGQALGKYYLIVMQLMNLKQKLIKRIKDRANRIQGHSILVVFRKSAVES